MATKSGRRVHISFSGHETKITLAWFEQEPTEGRGFKIVDLRYGKGQVNESMDKALTMLVPDWSQVFVSEFNKSIVSCELDRDPDLFDMIASAEEPEQFFISRYTLEYAGGRSAHLRVWDIEFAKQYAPLIEFNKQASARA